MAKKPLTPEEVKKLPPDERIKYLKELAEERKKEVDEEIAEAEDLIKESEEELEQPEPPTAPSEEELVALEQLVQDAPETQDTSQYTVPTQDYVVPAGESLDTTLQTAADQLQRLYSAENWGPEQVETYKESRRVVEKAQTYKISSETIEEELGIASGMLSRLRYKN